MPGIRPAAPNSTGTILAAPSPISAQPASPAAVHGSAASARNPNAASPPPSRSASTGGQRRSSASPASLPPAMVTENAAYPSPAVAGSAPRHSRSSTADQSSTAPSARNDTKHSAPSSASRPCGTTKPGPAAGARGSIQPACASSSPPAATASTAAPSAGASPAYSSRLATAAPTSPPRLYMPWNPLISGRPLARSTTTAWAFMAMSTVPSAAPNTASATTRLATPGASASSGSMAQNSNPPPSVTARVPRCCAASPASGIAASAPAPGASSTSPSPASSSPIRSLA